jgi:hypothetical protein
VDAEAYGPYELDSLEFDSAPIGGGGTDFVVFFDRLQQEQHQTTSDLVVYFTDGFKAKTVREALAKNPGVSANTLAKLAQDKEQRVRAAALANENCSEQIRLELADTTEDDAVWHALSETAPAKKSQSKKKTWQDALKLIQQPTGKGLYQLQRGTNARQLFVAKMISRHPKCPRESEETLRLLYLRFIE